MTQSVLIHCKPSLEQFLTNRPDLVWDYNTQDHDEIDVIVDNIDALNDEGLCEHYNIDYDQVNMIELL
jgi:hypothetical protein